MTIDQTTPTAQADDQQDAPECALLWHTPAKRTRALRDWRRAVFIIFGQQPRAIRMACVLRDLFHARDGFAFARNGHLAAEAAMTERHTQETLMVLEKGGAIVRATAIVKGKRMRVIYPAIAVIERAKRDASPGAWRGTPPGRHAPREASSIEGIINPPTPYATRRRRKLNERDKARLDAERRDRRNGNPSPTPLGERPDCEVVGEQESPAHALARHLH